MYTRSKNEGDVMKGRPEKKFNLKIVLSYMVLAVLALVVGFFIFSEIKIYLFPENVGDNDTKLLRTSSLLTHLYEAESLSKQALQTKTKANFKAYSYKIDSIQVEIDLLKELTESIYQKGLLDSVQTLLNQKVANSDELRNLKVRNDANNSLDTALEEFKKMEASLGKITPEALAPNLLDLSPKAQKVIRDIAAYLNENVPKDENELPDSEKIDSILNVSKALLNQAKLADSRNQRFLAQKERQLNANDMELSQKLRSIISAFEQEVMVNTYNDNLKKQSAVRKSLRLAGFAALLGFIIVGVFTFLINRDFWRIQTYRERLEKEKKYSESLLKSREQLISTVSHDLRTPLNTISGYSELMETTELTEKQLSYITNMRSASNYVDSLVNDLLDFSKLEAGKIKIEKIPFVLSDLLEQTSQNLKALYKGKKIDLSLIIDEKLKNPLLGDPFRIRQIITNLISNAYKFTSEGQIKVIATVEKEAGSICKTRIEICDSGIGIKKEKQNLIFKEFTQAEDHTEKKYGGYGLGLTISKKLAELLNGTIQLKSEEGKGSTFTFRLPLEISKVAQKSPDDKVTVLNKSDAFSILIIDDDSAMLQLLSEVCKDIGIDVHTFTNFNTLDKTASLEYSLVLTDIQMPGVDGFEVLSRLRSGAYSHYKNQAVIAMTGRRDLNTSVYQKAGFTELIQKPFSKKQLIRILNSLFPSHFSLEIEEKKPKIAKNRQKLFDLALISSFLGENREAMDEVLSTFMLDTTNNLKELKKGVSKKNYDKINEVAHRMLPMFRQLKVQDAISHLELLETATEVQISIVSLKECHLAPLQKTSIQLLKALRKRITRNPAYSD